MAEPPRVLIAAARFYADIAQDMVAGATAAVEAVGGRVERIDVPGAFELPAAIAWAARTQRFDGYVALGCVIRGQTSHYDYVCAETARALMDLTVGDGLPIGFGLLTVENREQAWARARVTEGDKGGAAARACLAMIEARRALLGSAA